MRFDPRIDSRIPLDSAVEMQEVRSHRRSTFCFEIGSLESGGVFSHSVLRSTR